MKKRDFLRSLGAGALGVGALGAGAASLLTGKPISGQGLRPARSNKNGIWINKDAEHTPDEWKRLFDRMLTAGVDAILFQAYNGHRGYWDTTKVIVEKDKLGMILPLAKAAGLEVHAWAVMMINRNEDILKKHP